MKLLLQGTNENELIHDDPKYGSSILVLLQNNTTLRIFEREPGVLELNANEVLHIEPRASNVVHIRLDQETFESGK